MKEHVLENKQKIGKITLWKKIHCYCPLGDDWYTHQLKIEFEPVDEFPDYIYIEKKIMELYEKKDYIIEDVVSGIYDIIADFCPSAKNIHVTSYVDDAQHLTVQVER